MNTKNNDEKKEEREMDQYIYQEEPVEEKHLTSDVQIRNRGHPSEMIPHHGNLTSNMPYKDIHDMPKPINPHLTCDVQITNRGHQSEMEPHHGKLETNMPYKDIHDKPKDITKANK